ncbi:MAG TPA: translocation/assembly module TamB domain-containing protein [Cyclobacteriaceae bacterium]
MQEKRSTFKRTILKVIRVFGWVWLGLIALLLVLALVIRIPAVQNKIVQRVVTSLRETTGAEISLDRIVISFPKRIVLDNLLIANPKKDTLLYAGRISVDADLMGLLSHRIQLNDVGLRDIKGRVTRDSHGDFNFQFILDSLAGEESPQDAPSEPWEFTIRGTSLDNIDVRYEDYYSGIFIDVVLKDLQARARDFDLTGGLIDLANVEIDGLLADLSIREGSAPETDDNGTEDEPETPLRLLAGTIEINASEVRFRDDNSGSEINFDLGSLRVEDPHVDIEGPGIAVDAFHLERSFIAYHQLAPKDTVDAVSATNDPQSKPGTWSFELASLSLKDNALQYHDFTAERTEGLDPKHLWITRLEAAISDIAVSPARYSANIESFAFHESGGFRLNSLTAEVVADSVHAMVDDLDLQTPHSRLRLSMEAQYPSLSHIADQLDRLQFNLTAPESYVGMRDVNLLAPMRLPLNLPDTGVVRFETVASGKTNNLDLERFSVYALGDTHVFARGSIQNISDRDALRFDVKLQEFRTTSSDIKTLLPDTLLPQSLVLPQQLALEGEFSGTLANPAVRATLESSFGSIATDAVLHLDEQFQLRAYRGRLGISQFELGQLLASDKLGIVDLEGTVEGAGLSLEDIDAYARVTVNEFGFNDYVYRDLVIDGSVQKSVFNGLASMDDPNLSFELKGDLDYSYAAEEKAYHFDLDLRQIDLQALNLLDRPLKAALKLSVDLDNADPKNLNGDFAIHDAAFNNGERIYRVDSLLVASLTEEGKASLNIDSDFLQARFSGSFDLLSLPTVLRSHFSNYYSLEEDTSVTGPQNFEFSIDLQNSYILTEVLVPDLERIDIKEIRGSFDSEDHRLDLVVNVNELVHKSFAARNMLLTANSGPRRLEYRFKADDILAGSIRVPSLLFDGTVAGDSIETGIAVYDSTTEERYVVRGVFRSLEDAYAFSLDDNLVLNYDEWSVPSDNVIRIGKSGFAAEHLDLTHEQERISINAPVGEQEALNISLANLKVQTLVNLAFADTLMRGTLDGDINILSDTTRGPVQADITLTNLAAGDEVLGDLKVKVDQPEPTLTVLDVSGDGPGLNIDVDGRIQSGPDQQLTLDANISALSLAALQPFLTEYVTGLNGTLKADLSVSGSTTEPSIIGSLTLQNAEALPAYTKIPIRLNNETVRFRDRTITLQNFTIRDRQNNVLTFNGGMTGDASGQYRLNLTTVARNFQLLNTKEGDNELFYGSVWLNTNARVGGSLERPEIDMTISLGDQSTFTFVVPQSEAGVMQSKGIVTFVDRDQPEYMAKLQEGLDTLASRAPFQGVILTARVELDDKETFTIVMDPVTGDQLKVNGKATLTLDIDETGNVNLTGRYELTKGSYEFTFYKLVKREFEIESGSYIVWNGEPMNAELNITALNRIDASPIDLFASQATDGSNMEAYRARLPFQVYLIIRGELLRPEISFRLDMPEQQRGAVGGSVYARIQDINTREQDLNKQVFALLILQRFVSDNPFETQSGGTLSAAARTSVNRMLSDQLNRMAQQIKGVELTFDLQSGSDYANGRTSEYTQLQLGVSKSLLDDRLVVKLAGNVDIEGGTQQGNASDYIGDLALEYKLTEDGRFRINGFYASDYDMIDGELKETGVGLIYIKDYNSLRELFKANDTGKK